MSFLTTIYIPGANTVTTTKLANYNIGTLSSTAAPRVWRDGWNYTVPNTSFLRCVAARLLDCFQPPGGTTLRIGFMLRGVGATATASICQNGNPVGAEQTENTGASVWKVQDIAGWMPGDQIGFWLKTSNAANPAFAYGVSVLGICQPWIVEENYNSSVRGI